MIGKVNWVKLLNGGGDIMTLQIKQSDWKFLRPKCPYKCIVYKSDRPVAIQDKEPEMVEEHCGKVIAVCIKLTNGEVFKLPKGMHLDVCLKYDISTHDVEDVGWELENGNFIWR